MMKAVILVLLSLASAIQLTDGACPTGWMSEGPGCYKFTPSSSMQEVMTYPEASASCDSIGGNIVVFDSYNEMVVVGNSLYVQDHMTSEFGKTYFFLVGCTDQAVEGTFMCEDGMQLALNSTLWRSESGQPSSAGSGGGSTDCVDYFPNANGLENSTCNSQFLSLCEVKHIAQNQTTQTPAQTTSQVSTTQTPAQTTSQVSTTQTLQQTTTQDLTTQTPQQPPPKTPTNQTPQQTTTQDPTTQTEAQATSQVSTTQTPAKNTNQDFATTVADEESCETSTGVTGVTRACQPSKHHLKSSVFSLAKDNEGRNLIGYCLTDHVMETVQMVGLIRCTMICHGIAGCKSFNYKGGVCELNDKSKESVGSRYLVQSDGCAYYELA